MTFAEETIQFEASEPYAQLFENFANAVLKGDESYLTVKGSEGINSLMLCASAYYSACKGIKVELPLEASDYKELMDELIKKEEENRFSLFFLFFVVKPWSRKSFHLALVSSSSFSA